MDNFPKWHAMKAVQEESEATGFDRTVLLHLILYTNQKGECFPSIATLAKACGFSEKTVRRSLSNLEKGIKGLPIAVVRSWRKGQWGRHSRHYTLKLGRHVELASRESKMPFDFDDMRDYVEKETVPQTVCVSKETVDSTDTSPNSSESLQESTSSNKRSDSPFVESNILERNGPTDRSQTVPQTALQTVHQTTEDYKEDYTEGSDPEIPACDLRSHASPEKPKPPSRSEARGAENEDDWETELEPANGPLQLRLDGSVEPSPKQVIARNAKRVWERYLELWTKNVGHGPVPKRTPKRGSQIKARNAEFGVDQVVKAVETLFREDSYWLAHGHVGIQYAVRSTEQTEKVLTKAAEMDDPSRRSAPPTKLRQFGNMSGDNAPVQKPPPGHKGYKAKVTYTEAGAFDQHGNPVELSPEAKAYRDIAEKRLAKKRSSELAPELLTVAEA